MIKILLVGVGNIGARHLQALAKLENKASIYVIDPSREALVKAEQLWDSLKCISHNVKYATEIKALLPPGEYIDVAIVATNSLIRKHIIEELSASYEVGNFILEKVLFQSIKDYDEIDQLFKKNSTKAWINCPRRYYPFYQELKKRLMNERSLEILISGSNWGMGCNTIHFLDLIGYICGIDGIIVDVSGLDKQLYECKRQGFFEVNGIITGRMGRCSRYVINSYSTGTAPISIIITTENYKCIIMESSQSMLWASKETDWHYSTVLFETLYVSDLTGIVINDILRSGDCNLTSWKEASEIHRAFEKPLVTFFSGSGIGGEICPIT